MKATEGQSGKDAERRSGVEQKEKKQYRGKWGNTDESKKCIITDTF